MKYTRDIFFYSKNRTRFSIFLAYWAHCNVWRRGAFGYRRKWVSKFIFLKCINYAFASNMKCTHVYRTRVQHIKL